eukprot:Nk52_evm3s151 gene=Nk52_evmTU3s151
MRSVVVNQRVEEGEKGCTSSLTPYCWDVLYYHLVRPVVIILTLLLSLLVLLFSTHILIVVIYTQTPSTIPPPVLHVVPHTPSSPPPPSPSLQGDYLYQPVHHHPLLGPVHVLPLPATIRNYSLFENGRVFSWSSASKARQDPTRYLARLERESRHAKDEGTKERIRREKAHVHTMLARGLLDFCSDFHAVLDIRGETDVDGWGSAEGIQTRCVDCGAHGFLAEFVLLDEEHIEDVCKVDFCYSEEYSVVGCACYPGYTGRNCSFTQVDFRKHYQTLEKGKLKVKIPDPLEMKPEEANKMENIGVDGSYQWYNLEDECHRKVINDSEYGEFNRKWINHRRKSKRLERWMSDDGTGKQTLSRQNGPKSNRKRRGDEDGKILSFVSYITSWMSKDERNGEEMQRVGRVKSLDVARKALDIQGIFRKMPHKAKSHRRQKEMNKTQPKSKSSRRNDADEQPWQGLLDSLFKWLEMGTENTSIEIQMDKNEDASIASLFQQVDHDLFHSSTNGEDMVNILRKRRHNIKAPYENTMTSTSMRDIEKRDGTSTETSVPILQDESANVQLASDCSTNMMYISFGYPNPFTEGTFPVCVEWDGKTNPVNGTVYVAIMDCPNDVGKVLNQTCQCGNENWVRKILTLPNTPSRMACIVCAGNGKLVNVTDQTSATGLKEMCSCAPGWLPPDCSIKEYHPPPLKCAIPGSLYQNSDCMCHYGFTGSLCEQYNQTCVNDTLRVNGNFTTEARMMGQPYKCICNYETGYFGYNCEYAFDWGAVFNFSAEATNTSAKQEAHFIHNIDLLKKQNNELYEELNDATGVYGTMARQFDYAISIGSTFRLTVDYTQPSCFSPLFYVLDKISSGYVGVIGEPDTYASKSIMDKDVIVLLELGNKPTVHYVMVDLSQADDLNVHSTSTDPFEKYVNASSSGNCVYNGSVFNQTRFVKKQTGSPAPSIMKTRRTSIRFYSINPGNVMDSSAQKSCSATLFQSTGAGTCGGVPRGQGPYFNCDGHDSKNQLMYAWFLVDPGDSNVNDFRRTGNLNFMVAYGVYPLNSIGGFVIPQWDVWKQKATYNLKMGIVTKLTEMGLTESTQTTGQINALIEKYKKNDEGKANATAIVKSLEQILTLEPLLPSWLKNKDLLPLLTVDLSIVSSAGVIVQELLSNLTDFALYSELTKDRINAYPTNTDEDKEKKAEYEVFKKAMTNLKIMTEWDKGEDFYFQTLLGGDPFYANLLYTDYTDEKTRVSETKSTYPPSSSSIKSNFEKPYILPKLYSYAQLMFQNLFDLYAIPQWLPGGSYTAGPVLFQCGTSVAQMCYSAVVVSNSSSPSSCPQKTGDSFNCGDSNMPEMGLRNGNKGGVTAADANSESASGEWSFSYMNVFNSSQIIAARFAEFKRSDLYKSITQVLYSRVIDKSFPILKKYNGDSAMVDDIVAFTNSDELSQLAFSFSMNRNFLSTAAMRDIEFVVTLMSQTTPNKTEVDAAGGNEALAKETLAKKNVKAMGDVMAASQRINLARLSLANPVGYMMPIMVQNQASVYLTSMVAIQASVEAAQRKLSESSSKNGDISLDKVKSINSYTQQTPFEQAIMALITVYDFDTTSFYGDFFKSLQTYFIDNISINGGNADISSFMVDLMGFMQKDRSPSSDSTSNYAIGFSSWYYANESTFYLTTLNYIMLGAMLGLTIYQGVSLFKNRRSPTSVENMMKTHFKNIVERRRQAELSGDVPVEDPSKDVDSSNGPRADVEVQESYITLAWGMAETEKEVELKFKLVERGGVAFVEVYYLKDDQSEVSIGEQPYESMRLKYARDGVLETDFYGSVYPPGSEEAVSGIMKWQQRNVENEVFYDLVHDGQRIRTVSAAYYDVSELDMGVPLDDITGVHLPRGIVNEKADIIDINFKINDQKAADFSSPELLDYDVRFTTTAENLKLLPEYYGKGVSKLEWVSRANTVLNTGIMLAQTVMQVKSFLQQKKTMEECKTLKDEDKNGTPLPETCNKWLLDVPFYTNIGLMVDNTLIVIADVLTLITKVRLSMRLKKFRAKNNLDEGEEFSVEQADALESETAAMRNFEETLGGLSLGLQGLMLGASIFLLVESQMALSGVERKIEDSVKDHYKALWKELMPYLYLYAKSVPYTSGNGKDGEGKVPVKHAFLCNYDYGGSGTGMFDYCSKK